MDLLNVDAVAAKLGVSVPLVWKLARTDGTFPKAVNLSKRVTRWIETDIEAWVLTKKQGEKDEADELPAGRVCGCCDAGGAEA